MCESARNESERRTKYDGWCSRWCELKARNFFVVLLMLFCWEIAGEEKERYRSSLRSIEQLVVVISYKNHFYSVATHQRKIFWYILRRRHKMRSFSFSLVSIAFNSTRARAFYFLCFYHVLLQQLCLYFLRNNFS